MIDRDQADNIVTFMQCLGYSLNDIKKMAVELNIASVSSPPVGNMAIPVDVFKMIHDEMERSGCCRIWPANDHLRMASLVAEEAGELLKAANDATRVTARPPDNPQGIVSKYRDAMLQEAIQTASTAIMTAIALKAEIDEEGNR